MPNAGESGWYQVGGTSLAAPLVAAVYALAGNTGSIDNGSAPYAYAGTGSLHDVTSGSNGSCSLTTYLCNGAAGYDGPTGVGTPNGTGAFSPTAADGSGAMVVSPSSVAVGSSGNTLTFTYTAATGGLSSGGISVTVPAGWSAPSTTGSAPGYTTSTCGTVGVSGSTIQLTGVTLAGGSTCSVTYGSKASSGPGATAQSSAGTASFATVEKSTAGGTLTALAGLAQREREHGGRRVGCDGRVSVVGDGGFEREHADVHVYGRCGRAQLGRDLGDGACGLVCAFHDR